MKLFEVKLREGEEHFTTSLVKDPAVEAKLIYFNAEKPTFFLNDEKRIVYSVAMRPNKKIFRKEVEGEPAYVFYTEETVEKFRDKYFKFQGQKLTNVNHSAEYLNDVYPVEVWQVKDENNDKTNAIGLEAFKGDLIMAFKVENDEVWQQCKDGNIDGLSIEAYFDNFEINKNEVKMSKQTFMEALKGFRRLFAEENVGVTVAIDGKSYSVTALEDGGLVTDENGEPLVNGSFEVEGVKYNTNDLGVISVATEMEEEEEKEAEEMEGEAVAPEAVEEVAEEVEQVDERVANLEVVVQDLKTELAEAKTELETMKAQTPKATVISRMPKATTTDFSKMTPLERYRFSKKQ
jgi:hypothetical protein